MENTYVFLDGGYLSKIAEHFYGKIFPKYCIKQFANNLAKSKGVWCKKAFFYTGEPYQSPTHPSETDIQRKKYHDGFIEAIEKIDDLVIRQGRCQKDDEGGYHQKGVDTLLTMDLFSLQNCEDNIKTIIVLICDTDFVPILKELKRKYRIKIIVAYFSDFKRGSDFSMSNHLWNIADDKILIDKGFFERSRRKK